MVLPVPADAVELCRRHHLIIRDVWPAMHGNSVFVARVTDGTGRELALKRTLPGRSRSEVAALSAWRETGAAARFQGKLEADVFLMEWLDGPCLADCAVASLDVPVLGRLLPVAEALLGADDPTTFLRVYLLRNRRNPLETTRERAQAGRDHHSLD